MVKKKNKTIKNSSRWKQNNASYRRRTNKAGYHVGRGRYLFGFIVLAMIVHFALKPAFSRILSHQIFTVRSVDVVGAEYIEPDKIIEAAGIEIGKNIFELDISGISEKVEHAFAAEDFTVYRNLPNAIAIRVHERKPVALLNMNSLVGVDKHGVPLPHVGAELVDNLPIVTGITSVSSLADSVVTARLSAGLNLLDTIRDKAPSTYKRISEINVSNTKTLGISLIDTGLEVIIGEKDWGQKIPLLDRIINEVSARKKDISSIDIRFGEKIVVRE